jgi:capsular exopolysaccharide synthesis family protein
MSPVDRLVSLIAPTSLEADQYRALRHTIERKHRESGCQVFGITSPGASEGKTITTLNLAGSLAQSRHSRVLVADADFHRPSVGNYLGLAPNRPGLAETIVDADANPLDAVQQPNGSNLSIIPSGVNRSGVYELLNAPRLGTLIQAWRQDFDYVLIDTPPVVPLPDCRLLSQWVDGFIIVVAAHKTPRRMFGEALRLLDPAKIIGTVFNGDDRPLSPYSNYYGYSPAPTVPERVAGSEGGWWKRTLKRGGQRGRS